MLLGCEGSWSCTHNIIGHIQKPYNVIYHVWVLYKYLDYSNNEYCNLIGYYKNLLLIGKLFLLYRIQLKRVIKLALIKDYDEILLIITATCS